MLQQVHRPWYSKCYSYKWQPKVFKTGPEFFSEWSSQKQFGDFWNFENFNSQFLPMRRPKTSIIWIMRDRRAKQDKSWESQALSTTYMGYIYLVALKVILGSFGALVIFENAIFKKLLLSAHCSQSLSDFSWIIFSTALTKLHLGFLKLAKLKF